MARIPQDTKDLEIIGYADRIDEELLPAVVPPIFRMKGDVNRVFLPPFLLSGPFVCNATEVDAETLKSLEERGEITRLEGDPIPAAPSHELWLNEEGTIQYEPRARVDRNLENIAERMLNSAEEALSWGHYGVAEHFAGIAFNADDRRAEPLAIKAVVRRMKGKYPEVQLMERLASKLIIPELFAKIVEHYQS